MLQQCGVIFTYSKTYFSNYFYIVDTYVSKTTAASTLT
jgi:hypothetical protein